MDKKRTISRAYTLCFIGGMTSLYLVGSQQHAVSPLPWIVVPPYVFGCLLSGLGLSLLCLLPDSKPVSPPYHRFGLVLTILLIYFSPFLYWWNRLPNHPYFTFNIFLMAFCFLGLQFCLISYALQQSRFAGNIQRAKEFRIWRTALVLGSLLPLGIIMVFTAILQVQHGTSWSSEVWELLREDLVGIAINIGFMIYVWSFFSIWRGRKCLTPPTSSTG